VECRWSGGSEWYTGKITGMAKDGNEIDVLYDDGDRCANARRARWCRR
jgi:hypothetical protein